MNAPTNILTVDVEEYWHVGRPGEGPRGRDAQLPSRVVADVERVLELLARARVRATFFVLGEVAAARPSLVASIAAEGHEIASHGFRHLPVDQLDPRAFGEDLDRSIEALAAAAGRSPRGYRAPIWSLSRREDAIAIVASRGFRYDSSLVPVPPLGPAHLPHQASYRPLPSGEIAELPPLTGRFGRWRFPLGFGLGLRLLPLSRIRGAILAENRRGRPAVVAFHPWEIDPEPATLRLAAPLAIAHGFGLEKLRARLLELLALVPFGTAEEALETAWGALRSAPRGRAA